MKSNKQRRAELTAKRQAKIQKQAAKVRAAEKVRQLAERQRLARLAIDVNCAALAPDNSYSLSAFVERGYYVDIPFRCRDCGKEEIWTAKQQKWWYEVAKVSRWTTAIRCRNCRRRQRQRAAASRRAHLEGLARKAKRKVL